MEKKEKPKTLSIEEKVSAFKEEYRQLCEKYGLTFQALPEYKLRDDGTFSLVLKMSIVPLKQ